MGCGKPYDRNTGRHIDSKSNLCDDLLNSYQKYGTVIIRRITPSMLVK